MAIRVLLDIWNMKPISNTQRESKSTYVCSGHKRRGDIQSESVCMYDEIKCAAISWLNWIETEGAIIMF